MKNLKNFMCGNFYKAVTYETDNEMGRQY